ncbi:hypothetical protein TNCV_157751 [Trichonephila clavipes]|nr:hypothetical protein TNCV_157751 [Trichonephila clavipes]
MIDEDGSIGVNILLVVESRVSDTVFDVEGGGISLDKEVDTIEEDSVGVNMLESTTLDIGIGGSGCKTVAALEDVEGSSSAWIDEDDVEITGLIYSV